jgi:hypothetical protein
MKKSHEWLEGILNDPKFRERVQAVVTSADTYLASQLARNLMQLRNEQRTNAYKQIFAARTKVSEDLLALQNSLSALIHYSAVAGEDANVFINLQRSVVTVTQKLSVFGEEDVDGDGMRDSQAQAPGTPADPAAAGNPERNLPSLDMDVDRAPIAPDNQPEPKTVLPADQVQQDPDDVTDENATTPSADGQEVAAPNEAAPADEAGNAEEDAPRDAVAPAAPAAPAPGAQPEQEGFDTGDDEGEAPAEEGAAPADGENPAPEEEEDEDSDTKAPEEQEVVDDKDKLHQEFGRLAQKGKKGKKGLFESLTDPALDAKPGEAAASVAEAKQTVKEKNFRFVYRGIRGGCVSAMITNKVYYFQPTPKLYGGDVNKLDVALRKHLETHPGYANALTILNQLRTSGKLRIIRRVQLSKQQLRKILHAPEQNAHAQLGSIKFDEGTAWRYRGVGLQKISNQEAAIWFEVGDTEYAVLPNKKVYGDKDIEDVNGGIQQKLKTLSYTDGLKYLVRLVHTKHLTPIYQGKIVA